MLATKVLPHLQLGKNGMAHLRDLDIRKLALELLELVVSSDLHLRSAPWGRTAKVIEGE